MKESNNFQKASLLQQKDESNISSYSSFLLENSEKETTKNKISSIEAENLRFTKHSPLVTLLIMSIGPLSNLVSVLFETLNMYLISRKYNNDENSHAVEIIGFSSQFQNLYPLIGNFFGQCFINQVSSLIGSGKREKAEQITADLFKITFFVSLLYGLILYFLIKPFLRFVGTPEDIMEENYKFNLFLLFFIPFNNLFSLSFCFLQSIGNSILLAIIVITSKIIQSAVLSPFFLFVCNVSTTYMKLSNCVVETIFSLLIILFVFIGRFSLKPKFSFLCTLKVSKDTLKSLVYPLPYILLFIGNCFAPMIILKCLTSNNNLENINQAIGGVFAVFNQINSINQALPSSIVVAFLASGNHSFGSGNIKRLKKLLFWTLVISLTTGLLFSFSVIAFRNQIAMWFIKGELELKIASKMLPIPFYTSFFLGFGLAVYSILLIIKKPILSMIPFAAQFVILCIGSEIFKTIFKDDFIKIFHVYNCADILCLIIYISELIYAINFIDKTENIDNQLTDNTIKSSDQDKNRISV